MCKIPEISAKTIFTAFLSSSTSPPEPAKHSPPSASPPTCAKKVPQCSYWAGSGKVAKDKCGRSLPSCNIVMVYSWFAKSKVLFYPGPWHILCPMSWISPPNCVPDRLLTPHFFWEDLPERWRQNGPARPLVRVIPQSFLLPPGHLLLCSTTTNSRWVLLPLNLTSVSPLAHSLQLQEPPCYSWTMGCIPTSPDSPWVQYTFSSRHPCDSVPQVFMWMSPLKSLPWPPLILP